MAILRSHYGLYSAFEQEPNKRRSEGDLPESKGDSKVAGAKYESQQRSQCECSDHCRQLNGV